MKHVIIGAGPAGVIAAETLRKGDANAEIQMIGGEPEPPYSRMAIPYLLEKNIDEGGTYLRKNAGHYDDLSIQYIHGRVESIAAGDNALTLEGGDKVAYDRLLVATGARPMKLPVPGMDLAGVHNCWTLEDARAIAKLATEGANVVLIGAGFIGCIILESLMKLAGNLSVVEMEERMVSAHDGRHRFRHVEALVRELDILVQVPAWGMDAGERIRIPNEVKLSCNDEVKTAMEDQLVDRYVPQLGATHGVYVMMWMSVPEVSHLRPNHRPKWPSIERARDELREQARVLSESAGLSVRSLVVDGSLR